MNSNLLNAMEIIRGINRGSDDFTIDILEVLENLESYEATEIPVFTDEEMEENEENQNLIDIEKNNVENMIDFLEEYYEYKEVGCNNTYNWSSPVNHDFYYHIYESDINDTIYIVMAIHKYGDVRCNYTNEFLLQFDYIEEFYEVLTYSNKHYYIETENTVEYDVSIDILSEGVTVNDEWYDTSDLNTIEELKEKLEAEESEEE